MSNWSGKWMFQMEVPRHLRRIHQEKYLNILQCTTRELRCYNASICLSKRCDSLWKFDFMLLIICFMSYYTKAKWTINFCLLIYRHFILSIYKNFAQLLSANITKKKKKRLFITAKTTLYVQMLWVWTYMFHIKSNSKR